LKIIFNIILLSLLFSGILTSSEILLQKNNVIITSDDLEKYKKLHNDYYASNIKDSLAIKKLYMTFKIVDYQSKINPNFLSQTNEIILEDLNKYKELYSEYIMSYFLRYEILKNDYISAFIKDYNLEALDNLLKEKFKIYNDNDCKIIINKIKFKELNNIQKKTIMSNLAKNSIKIDQDKFVCLNNENKKEINNLVNGIFLEKGNQEFLRYVHKNIK
jgi:hypothetical protein